MKRTLHCYAPGDGSLRFVWRHDKQALADPVTLEHARAWLNSPEGKEHKRRQRRVVSVQGGPVAGPALVDPVARVNMTTLRMGTRDYIYSIKPEAPPECHEPGKILDCFLDVRTPNLADPDEPLIEVRHLSTRGSLLFFLNHEEELRAFPIEPYRPDKEGD